MAVLRFNVTFYDDVIGTGNGQNRNQRPRISRKTYNKLVFQKFHYENEIMELWNEIMVPEFQKPEYPQDLTDSKMSSMILADSDAPFSDFYLLGVLFL